MLKKTCPYCQSNSYSSTTRGQAWLCPNCGKDISHIPTEAPLPPRNNESSREPNNHSIKDTVNDIIRKIMDS